MVVTEPSLGIEQSVERFERDGYVVLKGALGGDEVAALVDAVDRIWTQERGDLRVTGASPLHLLAFCGREPEFLELLDHPSILPLAIKILGTNIFMYHCHLDVHPPERDSSQPWMWHQDGGVQNRDLDADPRPGCRSRSPSSSPT
jgi:ectoine hydroxylase